MAFGDLQFAETDARRISDQLKVLYEAIRRANGEPGYRLAEADPERLVQLTEAAALAQVATDIDLTGKGNLLLFAGEDTIEYLGDLYGERGKRLPASFALTTIRFSLGSPQSTVTIIPLGSRITADNKIFFATTKAAQIPAGSIHVDVEAQCLIAGQAGMGYEIGDIKNIVDLIPFIVSAENITPTSGGTDKETLEDYRARIRTAPESFSVAGPDGAYDFWARSANPGIIDAKVWMPALDVDAFGMFLSSWGITNPGEFIAALNNYYRESGTGPGNVNVAVLMRDGIIPSEEVMIQVFETLNDKRIRPLTDYLHVIEPKKIEYNINFKYWILESDSTIAAGIIDAVENAVQEYIQWQKSKLGLDINPSYLYELIMKAGPKRIEIIEPTFQVLEPWEVAGLQGEAEINFEGLELE